MNNVFFPQVNFCFTNEATEEVYAEYFAKREEELEAIGVDDEYTNMLYRTAGAAAFDLLLPVDATLHSGEVTQVDLGVALDLPEGLAAILMPRSSCGKPEFRIALSNTIGLIDSDFKHSIRANFVLEREGSMYLHSGERFAQLLIIPYVKPNFNKITAVEHFRNVEGTTQRKGSGFGETGK